MKVARKVLRILVLAWIALAVTPPGVSGLVLCIGADGHFSFEWSHEGRCQSSADAPGHGNLAVIETPASAHEDCCGDCVDVSLFSDTASRLTKEVRRYRLPGDTVFRPLAEANAAFSRADVPTDRANLFRRARLGLSSFLLAQRTVVLRI